MCFGNQTQKTVTTTPTPYSGNVQGLNEALASAEALNQNYTPYGGQMVATPGALQTASWGAAGGVGGQAPGYLGEAGQLYGNVAGAAPSSVYAPTIQSMMQPYMSQYVASALAPQLSLQDIQFQGQNKQLDAAATASGAYGDARAGIEAANLSQAQDLQRSGLVANAFNTAFNTAIGAGAQDAATNLQAQTTTAGLRQAQLQNALSGGNALSLLGQYGLGTENTYGQQQTGLTQEQLNAMYQNTYLGQQQWDLATQQLLNQTLGTGAQVYPATTTAVTTAPDNSGFGFLGSMAGPLISGLFNGGTGGFGASALGMLLSDEREKENIRTIGNVKGIPVKAFNWKRDPRKTPQVGFTAQDVEKKYPSSVVPFKGRKYINYGSLGAQLGLNDNGGQQEAA